MKRDLWFKLTVWGGVIGMVITYCFGSWVLWHKFITPKPPVEVKGEK